MTALHINSPRWSDVRRLRRKCPTCERRTTQCAAFQEWYGWTVTCLSCGDSWTDGVMNPRPFEPGWRKRSIASARRLLGGEP